MTKKLFISEKPSVAREFANALGIKGGARDGYIEKDDYIVTWCVGHLVTMSYPDKYDEKYKKWALYTLPFLPEKYLYEIIPSAKKQFNIVSSLLARDDVAVIYVCTDSGREGEYIYRLVEQMSPAKVKTKERRRVWIDSQTEDEIKKGIREAKALSAYDDLASSAFLRAKEDYLMGINFSRLLTLKYGQFITDYLGTKWTAVAVGRVMTCVLGMVVRRENEIRNFVKTPFFRINVKFGAEAEGKGCDEGQCIDTFWHDSEQSRYHGSPKLYKDSGFNERKDAKEFVLYLNGLIPHTGKVISVSKKTENVNPPLLYNLAELQNDCSKRLHISPDETLKIAQELYEKKLTTYPRTDARVLSSAIAKEINKNIGGLANYAPAAPIAKHILDTKSYARIGKTKYTNDKLITDHYAIIPTGQGFGALSRLTPQARTAYDMIVVRFLSIFYPQAKYAKTAVEIEAGGELFNSNFKILKERGYLEVGDVIFGKNSFALAGVNSSENNLSAGNKNSLDRNMPSGLPKDNSNDVILLGLKKGDILNIGPIEIKEGSTTPPKRYTSGSMILAMENAGQLIEDPDLREQIKGSGIGTSATRAEILKKLFTIKYLKLNKKTQVITPELLGEMVYYTVGNSISAMLQPKLTASWEKGLTYVAEGKISSEEYMKKLESFIIKNVDEVKDKNNLTILKKQFDFCSQFYKKKSGR